MGIEAGRFQDEMVSWAQRPLFNIPPNSDSVILLMLHIK